MPELLKIAVPNKGSLSEADFATWMRPRLQSRTPKRVHEPKKRYG